MNPNDRASEILAARREKNKKDQEARIKEVYQTIPQMESVDRQIKELGFAIVSKEMRGISVDKARDEMANLISTKRRMLVENGYEPTYMDLKFHHDLCEDTGFVGTEICACRRQLIIDEKYNQSNISKLLTTENFNNFDLSLFSDNPYPGYGELTPRANINQTLSYVSNYIENFKNETTNLYIFGDVGRGKTFLLNSIAKELLDKNYSVLYMTSSRLFSFLKDYNWSFEEQRAKHEEQFNFILNVDLLIIDDLGSEPSSKNDAANFFEVVNNRMISGKPIIFSTNYNEDELGEMYGDRIFSRIMGNSEVIEIFGEDLRLR